MILRHVTMRSFFSALLLQFAMTLAAVGQESHTLKDVFDSGHNAAAEGAGLVGKLALVIVEPDGARQVPPSYAFRSGDKFRFEVSSNLDGWLYIFHRARTSHLTQLWPRKGDGKVNNRVLAKQTYVVPPSPGVFIFDKQVGDEYFYIAINTMATQPVLDSAPQDVSPSVAVDQTASRKPATTQRNYLVKDPFGGQGKGVTFDPGTGDAAPYIYFSAVPGDARTRAMLEIRLSHTD